MSGDSSKKNSKTMLKPVIPVAIHRIVSVGKISSPAYTSTQLIVLERGTATKMNEKIVPPFLSPNI